MKKELIIIFILIVLVVGGGLFFLKSKSKPEKKVLPTPTPEEEVLPTLSDSEFKVILTPTDDKKYVYLKIEKYPKGTKSIEYELTYDADKQGNIAEQGVNSTIIIEKEGEVINRKITLGTCSKNVCVFDTVIGNLKLTIRVETEKGIKTWFKEFPLESTE